MAFTLDKVIPWGRSCEEYLAMSGLTNNDLRHRILGCGDGPASFNSELTKRGGHVVSIDPIYALSAGQIQNRISETYETVIRQMYEIRIFPLLDLSGLPSPYVEPVAEAMKRSEYRVSIEPVPYEFQRGGNKIMRITASVRKSRRR